MLNSYKDCLEEIDSFLKYPENWDGYDGLPIATSAAENSKKFIEILNVLDAEVPKPFISPVPNGNVQLEWLIGSKFIEFEISQEECAYIFEYGDVEENGCVDLERFYSFADTVVYILGIQDSRYES